MNTKWISPWIVGLFLLLAVPVPTWADGGCIKCHQENSVVVKPPQVRPIILMIDGEKKAISLMDAYAFHGHECPGMTVAYLAVQYGLERLYGDEVPVRDDLMISSRIPARGPMDLIDLIMKGDKQSSRTWPPVGMKKSRNNFSFCVFRKSSCEAVDVRLKPEWFPEEFFKLKKKQKAKTITPEEWERLHGYMADIITGFPEKSKTELFGDPRPHKIVWWGSLTSGEMDRHIRKLRKEHKKSEK